MIMYTPHGHHWAVLSILSFVRAYNSLNIKLRLTILLNNRQPAGFYTRDQANKDHDGAGDVAEEGDPGGEGGILLLPGEPGGGEVVPGHGCLG